MIEVQFFGDLSFRSVFCSITCTLVDVYFFLVFPFTPGPNRTQLDSVYQGTLGANGISVTLARFRRQTQKAVPNEIPLTGRSSRWKNGRMVIGEGKRGMSYIEWTETPLYKLGGPK